MLTSGDPKRRKNRVVLRKIIDLTISNEMTWSYINKTVDTTRSRNTDKYIFIYGENLGGTKYIVYELSMYTNINLNRLDIYMQSVKNDEKIFVKEITGGSKTLELSYEVLKNVEKYNEGDEFAEVWDELFYLYAPKFEQI